jgi:hypothetical protein
MSNERAVGGGATRREWMKRGGAARMGARTWAIAYLYHEPAAYGVPELPEWTVSRVDEDRLAFAADGETEPFISAGDPMRVRR